MVEKRILSVTKGKYLIISKITDFRLLFCLYVPRGVVV